MSSMAGDWLSIPQVALKAGVSDNSVRRYIQRFPAFFPGRVFDGVVKYPAETIRIVTRVTELYKSGCGRAEVQAALAEEFPATITPAEDVAPATTLPAMPLELLERMTLAMEGVADQKQRLDALALENAGLRERVERLEAMLTAGNQVERNQAKGSWWQRLIPGSMGIK